MRLALSAVGCKDWVERYESEPRHQRIRNTPTYMSSVFAQDPLPHPIRTNPTFESHILGGAAVQTDPQL